MTFIIPSPNLPQDFLTHFNYAKCMNGMMTDIKIHTPVNMAAKIEVEKCQKFFRLAKLTSAGISSEAAACKSQPDYSEIVAPWIAVKCYYRIYYLESLLVHLSLGDSKVFMNGGHAHVRRMINGFCASGYYSSKLKEIEKVTSIEDALQHKIKMGQNITQSYCYSQDCIKSVRAKIAVYVEEQWKANEHIKRYSTQALRAKRDAWKLKHKVTLLDFFLQMRLKANYKDADFLNVDTVPAVDLGHYITLYVSAANKYTEKLVESISAIETLRGVKISS